MNNSLSEFFCIAGAPKCGTSAMYEYLKSHPRIYMPLVKEPHYYATDCPDLRMITCPAAYEELFSGRDPRYSHYGEASAWYLFSKVAVPNMLRENPNAKIIVMLRRPSEMLPSLHNQMMFTYRENEPDFARAWELQGERKQGRYVPPGCVNADHLQYRAVGSFGEQLLRLYQHADRSQVLVLLHDDLKQDTAACYRAVLDFLEVPDDGRENFAKVNEARSHRYPGLMRWIVRPPYPLNLVKSRVRRWLGAGQSSLLRPLYNAMAENTKRTKLSPAMQDELHRVFAEDIHLLEDLLERNLSHWTTTTSAHRQVA